MWESNYLHPGKDVHKKRCLLVCLFALSPPEEKKRRQVKELGGGVVGDSVVQEIEGRGGETELLTEEKKEREGRGNHVEVQSCDNCPTSMHRWVSWEYTRVTSHTASFQTNKSNSIHFYRSHPKKFFTTYICLFFVCFFQWLVVLPHISW